MRSESAYRVIAWLRQICVPIGLDFPTRSGVVSVKDRMRRERRAEGWTFLRQIPFHPAVSCFRMLVGVETEDIGSTSRWAMNDLAE